MSKSEEDTFTLVFRSPKRAELSIGKTAYINGVQVDVDTVAFRNETECVDEMKELLEQIYDMGICEDQIDKILVKTGYWEPEDDE
jgi:Ni,Fe-hydrogenase III large subunit